MQSNFVHRQGKCQTDSDLKIPKSGRTPLQQTGIMRLCQRFFVYCLFGSELDIAGISFV